MRAPVLTFKRARRLRRQMTLPEVILWECLRKGRLNGLSFRRQHPLGPYILDFYQPAAKLAVEIDGDAHGDAAQAAHDARRDAWLRGQGIRVLRIPAKDVLDDELREGALTMIAVASVPALAESARAFAARNAVRFVRCADRVSPLHRLRRSVRASKRLRVWSAAPSGAHPRKRGEDHAVRRLRVLRFSGSGIGVAKRRDRARFFLSSHGVRIKLDLH